MSEKHISGMIIPIDGKNVLHNFRDIECYDYLSEMVNNGPKNQLLFDGLGKSANDVSTSYTSNGITFAIQSDGSIRVTGSISSGSSYCYFYKGTSRINIIDFFDGKHVLSGNPSGSSLSTWRLWYKVGSETSVSAVGEYDELPEETGQTNAVLGMQVDAPQTNIDITFKPMICLGAAYILSDKYAPYRPSYQELYDTVNDLQNDRAALVELVDGGAKNIADGRHSDITTGGVAFDFADDGTCTATGTQTNHKATSSIMLSVCTFTPKAGVTYVVSGCPTGGSNNTFAVRVTTAADSTVVWETGSGVSFTPSTSDPLTIKFSIKSGTVCDGLVFKPMICTVADYEISQAFVPYRPSWQEMYEMIQALQT